MAMSFTIQVSVTGTTPMVRPAAPTETYRTSTPVMVGISDLAGQSAVGQTWPEATCALSVHHTVNPYTVQLNPYSLAQGQAERFEVGRMPDLGRIAGPIVIPNAIEVDLVWNLTSGKQVKNVLHGQVAAGFNATPSDATVSLRDLRPPNMPVVTSTGAPTAGTGVATALPRGASLVISERAARAGRGFRGRIYLPGLDSSLLTAATGAASAAGN